MTAVPNEPKLERGRFACTTLPPVPGAAPSSPQYLIVDLTAHAGVSHSGPARVHLYHLGGANFRVVGLERPEDGDPPG